MREPTQEQIARLPKWAQDHLKLATHQRDEARKQLADYCDSQRRSKVFTGYHDSPRFIQEDRVTFIVPNGQIVIQITNTGLECMGQYTLGNFIVKPSSSNVVYLAITKED